MARFSVELGNDHSVDLMLLRDRLTMATVIKSTMKYFRLGLSLPVRGLLRIG